MSITLKRQRTAGLLLFASALLVAATAGMASGFIPVSATASADSKTAQDTVSASCNVHYFALDDTQTKANPDKVSPEDLGPRGNAESPAKAYADLNERRECGTDGKFDTELLATQYADWSSYGFTSEKVNFSGIDAFRKELNDNPAKYHDRLAELKDLESHGNMTFGTVGKGVWSVYALPNGKGDLTTHIGKTGSNGTTLKFTYKGATIQYRLECGFQIVRPSQLPGLPVCDYNDCGPKPPAPTTPSTPTPPSYTPPTNTPPTHSTPPTPSCPPGWNGTPPNCKKPASTDPYPQGNAPRGGGHNAVPGPGTYVPPAQNQPLPTAPRQNPAPPVGGSSSSGGSAGGTGGHTVQPKPDPAPAPSREPEAPAPSAPETGGSSCPAGVPDCG